MQNLIPADNSSTAPKYFLFREENKKCKPEPAPARSICQTTRPPGQKANLRFGEGAPPASQPPSPISLHPGRLRRGFGLSLTGLPSSGASLSPGRQRSHWLWRWTQELRLESIPVPVRAAFSPMAEDC